MSVKNDNLKICKLCKRNNTNLIKLRDDSSVCQSCVDESRNRLFELREEKLKIERTFNIWDKVGLLLGAASFISGFFIALYIPKFSYFSIIFSVILGYFLWDFFQQKSKSFKETALQVVNEERKMIKGKLIPIFDLYLKYPPDWAWRRGQVRERDNRMCQECDRKWLGSVVPFHVHHIIPISKAESSHRFDNLIFLCELCHSKINDSHSLVKIARENRLNGKHKKKRNWVPSALERNSVYW